MASYFQETIPGQLLRLISGNKIFRYPEEDPNFVPPWLQAEATEKKAVIENAAPAANADSSSSNHTLDGTPGPNEKTDPIASRRSSERRLSEREGGLATIPTQASTSARDFGVVTTRTRTREQTRQYTQERYDVEQQEAAERQQSSVIAPQVTSDGITLIDWYTTDDPANPQNWNSWYKAFVTFIIAMYTFGVYCASAIYTPAEGAVMEKFGVQLPKASLGLSMYVIGYGVGPLLFSPLSEIPVIGRNWPYIVSYFLFVVLSVPTALSNSLATLLVLRFLTGFMGSPCLATGGATMGDMYGLLKLPYALTAWVAASFCAPALGPLISGFAVQLSSWRWALWLILIMNGPIFLLMLFFLPETSASNILLRRAQRLRKATGNNMLKSQSEIDQGNATITSTLTESIVKPLEITIKDPSVLFVNTYSAFIYGIYYSFFEAFPLVYIGIYNFSLGELGLVFLCIIVGCVIGIIIYCSYVWFYLEPDIKKNGLRAQEHRLVPALFACMFLPASMFWFGWTSEKSIHWIVSIIGIMFFAIGAFVLFQCIFMYLPLTYPTYAASLFAANDFCRSAWAAGSIIYAHPLYVNLGIGNGISVLASLLILGVVGIWVLYFYGAKLRARSKFAMS